jgi:2-polyprenyl-6-methoxyphenol hydroxylase-like FAD-dependent oxidoreductase
MPLDADVCVIGAGPAGLAAAIVLGQHGISVAVLERQTLPADKVCGEGMMPPGVRFLEQTGAAQHLSPADLFPFAGIRYVTPRGRHVQADFLEGPGQGIRRTALSRALHTVASALPSVTIRPGIHVTALRRSAGAMHVVTQENFELTCRLIVGADGLHSRVRRWAGLAGAPAHRQRFGIRRHFQIAPWSRFVEVHSGPGFEAYLTPCGPDRVGLAILWDKNNPPASAAGGQFFSSLLAHLPSLSDRLSRAAPLNEPRAAGPFHQRTTRRTTDGIALLGDASGYLDPCTGEGLTLAFNQARALEACLVPALQSSPPGPLLRPALRGYERDWRTLLRPYLLCTRAMLFCHRHPAFFERVMSFLARRPDILPHFLSFNMGAAPLWPGFRRTARGLLPPRSTTAENS